ncbi:MAG: repeat-like domain, partial [Thermoplasmata archaeon]|nr:repeat-like domain [Thermoplasmata archaeon]
NDQAESFIAVSPDGRTVLTCLHGKFAEASPMFASTDGGATFRRLAATPQHGVGGDCEVALGADGTWYFLASTVATETVSATRDGGASWTHAYLTSKPSNGAGDRPWLEAAGDTLILTTMPLSGVPPGEPGGVGIVRSTDHGATWSEPQDVGGTESDTLIVEGHPLVGPDGDIRVALLRSTRLATNPLGSPDGPCRLFFAVSRDTGATWSEEPVAQVDCLGVFGSSPTATAVAGDGTLYWAYGVANGTRADLVAVTSRDGGKTWSAPQVVWGGLGTSSAGWMDGRPDGGADLVMVGDAATGAALGQLRLLRLDARHPGLVVAQADLGQDELVEFLAVDHDAAGHAFIAYTDRDILYSIREMP